MTRPITARQPRRHGLDDLAPARGIAVGLAIVSTAYALAAWWML